MLLGWLISAIGGAALKGEVSAMAQRAGRRTILYALAVVLWLTACGFAIAAFTVWLAGQLGVIAACTIIAAALAVIGLALQLGLAFTASRRNERSVEKVLAALAAQAEPPAAVGEGSALGSLALVAILGWLLARQVSRK
ncbi:MAG: hypothetical protein NUV72_04510 [Bauldia sp.]|nr:hypothetical protein [Bauldia sp.]